jgi:hypothetical protein
MTKDPVMSRGFRLLSALGLLSACACSSLDNCPDQQDPVSVLDGETDRETLDYESAPWQGPLTHFPAKTAVWFRHDLGVTPLDVTPYLSFADVGTTDDDKHHGSVTTSAGNQSLIDCVDSRVIVLRNDTCEPSFYVRLTAQGRAPTNATDKCCAKNPDLPACKDDP